MTFRSDLATLEPTNDSGHLPTQVNIMHVCLLPPLSLTMAHSCLLGLGGSHMAILFRLFLLNFFFVVVVESWTNVSRRELFSLTVLPRHFETVYFFFVLSSWARAIGIGILQRMASPKTKGHEGTLPLTTEGGTIEPELRETRSGRMTENINRATPALVCFECQGAQSLLQS